MRKEGNSLPSLILLIPPELVTIRERFFDRLPQVCGNRKRVDL